MSPNSTLGLTTPPSDPCPDGTPQLPGPEASLDSIQPSEFDLEINVDIYLGVDPQTCQPTKIQDSCSTKVTQESESEQPLLQRNDNLAVKGKANMDVWKSRPPNQTENQDPFFGYTARNEKACRPEGMEQLDQDFMTGVGLCDTDIMEPSLFKRRPPNSVETASRPTAVPEQKLSELQSTNLNVASVSHGRDDQDKSLWKQRPPTNVEDNNQSQTNARTDQANQPNEYGQTYLNVANYVSYNEDINLSLQGPNVSEGHVSSASNSSQVFINMKAESNDDCAGKCIYYILHAT